MAGLFEMAMGALGKLACVTPGTVLLTPLARRFEVICFPCLPAPLNTRESAELAVTLLPTISSRVI